MAEAGPVLDDGAGGVRRCRSADRDRARGVRGARLRRRLDRLVGDGERDLVGVRRDLLRRRRRRRRCSRARAPGIHAGMFGPVGQRDARRRRLRGLRPLPVRQRLRARDVDRRRRDRDRRDGEPSCTRRRACPRCASCFLPPEQVEFRGNWDVMGLAGTGSYDYAVDRRSRRRRLHVRSARTPSRGAAVRCTASALLGLTAAGPRRRSRWGRPAGAREVLAHRADQAPPGRSTRCRDQQLFQHDFAMHDAAMRAARAYVFESFAEARGRGARGGRRRHWCSSNGCGRRRRTRPASPPTRRGSPTPWAGHRRAAQPERAAALLPRHPRGRRSTSTSTTTRSPAYTQALLMTPPDER